jgi:hypothetical protein
MRHFLHWPCRSAICASPRPRAPTTPATVKIGRGRGIGEAGSQRVDVAFVDDGETRRGGGIDSSTKGRRKVAADTASEGGPCGQLAGGLESQALRWRHVEGRITAVTGDETMLPKGARRIRTGSQNEAFFSLAASHPAVGNRGLGGQRWSSPRPQARRPMQEREGRKGDLERC